MKADLVILNLGCGVKAHPACTNVDWSPYAWLTKRPVLRWVASHVLSEERRVRLAQIPSGIVAHDLRSGIPFPDSSVDVIYHSHLFEHVDRENAPSFLREILRVLKPGGLHRVVVPDLERLCSRYLDGIKRGLDSRQHEANIADILEQMVRREASGTSKQRPLWRVFENLVLGDARRRGETHQWMYDRLSLTGLLATVGFQDIRIHTHVSSDIPEWVSLGLDRDDSGGEYKPGSLYVEARKPE